MFQELVSSVNKAETISYIGKIENIVGMTIEASGGRASIGDISMIYSENKNEQMPAEVVGFKDDRVLLMPYDNMSGISAGSFVRNTKQRLKIPVSDNLRGRIVEIGRAHV